MAFIRAIGAKGKHDAPLELSRLANPLALFTINMHGIRYISRLVCLCTLLSYN